MCSAKSSIRTAFKFHDFQAFTNVSNISPSLGEISGQNRPARLTTTLLTDIQHNPDWLAGILFKKKNRKSARNIENSFFTEVIVSIYMYSALQGALKCGNLQLLAVHEHV